jgi:hypothetical protein
MRMNSLKSLAMIRYLQAARSPFLMPVVIRCRTPADPRGPSGTRVFAASKRSGWFAYGFDDLLALAKLLDLAHSWLMARLEADQKDRKEAA